MATRIALAAVSPGTRRRWLNGPAVDFLTLGGGSFIVLGAMAALFPRDDTSRAALAAAMLFLAYFVSVRPHRACRSRQARPAHLHADTP